MVLDQKVILEDSIKLELELSSKGFIEICLFDEIGQLVYNYCDYITPGFHEHSISTQNLSAGPYLLRIAQNGSTVDNEILTVK